MSKSKESHHGKFHLDKHILPQFGMAKVFKYHNSQINGLDIDNSGRYLLTTSTDSCVRLYDCLDAKLRKTIECKKYSASCIQFTHHSKSVLLASHQGNNNGNNNSNNNNNSNMIGGQHNVIRYLSLHDNAYIRTFYGHTDRITELSLSNLDDTFMSCSIDRHIRLWDLRKSQCIAICKVTGRPTVAQDPEGLIFAIGTGKNELKLYDRRKYQHGPFETITTFPQINYEWCNMCFSPDGKYILISTRTNLLMLVDSFKGTLIGQLNSYKNSTNDDIKASFTPNGKFIVCGSSNGDIHFWSKDKIVANFKNNNVNNNNIQMGGMNINNNINGKVTIWKGHPRPIKYFKWNPKYLTAVSAAQHISLWLPRNINSNLNIKNAAYPKKSSLKKKSHNKNNNHNKK